MPMWSGVRAPMYVLEVRLGKMRTTSFCSASGWKWRESRYAVRLLGGILQFLPDILDLLADVVGSVLRFVNDFLGRVLRLVRDFFDRIFDVLFR